MLHMHLFVDKWHPWRPGAGSGDEWKSEQAGRNGAKESQERGMLSIQPKILEISVGISNVMVSFGLVRPEHGQK